MRGLVKEYKDGTRANRGIDLEVRRGEIVAVLGPNGAGKTTFLRQLTTELRPSGGDIRVFGIDVIREPQKAKRLMGITPQEAGTFDTLTTEQHLELFARLKGLSRKQAIVATAEIGDVLGLTEHFRKPVGSLSGGQRRRILIGLALIGRPPLLVERVFFGSHAPYFPCESAVFKLFESPLGRPELEKVMRGNAARFLKG